MKPPHRTKRVGAWPATPDELRERNWQPHDIHFHVDEFWKPKRAFIVGMGPLGKPYHDQIPFDTLNIALNAAHPTIDANFCVQMIVDSQARFFDWFDVPPPNGVIRITSDYLAHIEPRTKADYTFHYEPGFDGERLLYGVFHIGLGVAGCAVQFLRLLGIKDITFIGVDQFGPMHHDGECGAPRHRGEWSCVKSFNKMLRLMEAEGFVFHSISPTRLDIKDKPAWPK